MDCPGDRGASWQRARLPPQQNPPQNPPCPQPNRITPVGLQSQDPNGPFGIGSSVGHSFQRYLYSAICGIAGHSSSIPSSHLSYQPTATTTLPVTTNHSNAHRMEPFMDYRYSTSQISLSFIPPFIVSVKILNTILRGCFDPVASKTCALTRRVVNLSTFGLRGSARFTTYGLPCSIQNS